MRKKKSRKQSKQVAPTRSRRKLAALIALTVILATSGAIIAGRTSLWARLTGATLPISSAEPQSQPTPTKEYYYAGGKLVATEQTEASGGCSYSISPTSRNFTAAGGSDTVNVTAGAGCAWTATSNAGWISVTSGASGSGNGTVGYTVASNSGSSRIGTMTIAGLTFTVNQDAAGGCTYSISPTSKVFTSVGGVAAVNITAGAGCAWTSVSNASWITITQGASGSGNGQTKYQVAANNTGVQRIGTLTIAGKTHTVTQNP